MTSATAAARQSILVLFASVVFSASAVGALVDCTTGFHTVSTSLVSSTPPVVIAGGTCEMLVTGSITSNGTDTFSALLGEGNADVTIDGGSVVAQGASSRGRIRSGVQLLENAQLTLLAGEVSGEGSGTHRAGILAEGHSQVLMFGGTATATGSGSNAQRSAIQAKGNSDVVILDGLLQAMGSGTGERIGIFARDRSTVTVLGGEIVLGSRDTATSSHLFAREDSVITIHGDSFNFPPGPIAPLTGTLTGSLADGSPIAWSFRRISNGQIVLVPEPSAWVLFAVGCLALAWSAAKRRRPG